jgi:DNA gyrase/topoisomerase IV subunit B
MDYKWLLFCPQLPATPSSPRVMVWRRMRTAGSLGLDNGLWILPYTESAEKFVQEIKSYIENQGGTSKTFLANAFDELTETEILERFCQDRAEEYAELNEQCVDFLGEIDKETARQNFSFAEYEENEQDLVKLEAWFEKVKARDFLGGLQAEEAIQWLEKCRQSLQNFANEVYTHEGSHPKIKSKPGPVPPGPADGLP